MFLLEAPDHAHWHLLLHRVRDRSTRARERLGRRLHGRRARQLLVSLCCLGQEAPHEALVPHVDRGAVDNGLDPLALEQGEVRCGRRVDAELHRVLEEGGRDRVRRVLLDGRRALHDGRERRVRVGLVGRDLPEAEAPFGERARLVEGERRHAREQLELP